jgi:hypothetical protein
VKEYNKAMDNTFPTSAVLFVRENFPGYILQPASNGSPMWFTSPDTNDEIVIYRSWGKVDQYTNAEDTSGRILFTGVTP